MSVRWRDLRQMREPLWAALEVVCNGGESDTRNERGHGLQILRGNSIESRDGLVAIRHFLEQVGVGVGL